MMSNPPRTIAIYLYDDVEVLDFAGPYEVFTTAARLHARRCPGTPPLLQVLTVAKSRGIVRTRAGLIVIPEYDFATAPQPEVLLIPGGVIDAEIADDAVLAWVQEQAAQVQLLASVCTGSFILGQAGLLDGKRATTHWEDLADLAARFPRVEVVGGVRFVDEGSIVTAAGIAAGIDLSLYLIERWYGVELALGTARQMDYPYRVETLTAS